MGLISEKANFEYPNTKSGLDFSDRGRITTTFRSGETSTALDRALFIIRYRF